MGERLNWKRPDLRFQPGEEPERWEQRLTTKTVPLKLPETKIAVKVIDQTGMEHMTVIDDPRNSIKKV